MSHAAVHLAGYILHTLETTALEDCTREVDGGHLLGLWRSTKLIHGNLLFSGHSNEFMSGIMTLSKIFSWTPRVHGKASTPQTK